jgi:hypothetical protein
MSQSNYIAAAIAIAFIVYITVKGSLPKYLGILTGSGGFGTDTASAGNTPQKTASAATNSDTKSSDTASSAASTADAASTAATAANAVVGGDAGAILDGVHMFDLAGMMGAM